MLRVPNDQKKKSILRKLAAIMTKCQQAKIELARIKHQQTQLMGYSTAVISRMFKTLDSKGKCQKVKENDKENIKNYSNHKKLANYSTKQQQVSFGQLYPQTVPKIKPPQMQVNALTEGITELRVLEKREEELRSINLKMRQDRNKLQKTLLPAQNIMHLQPTIEIRNVCSSLNLSNCTSVSVQSKIERKIPMQGYNNRPPPKKSYVTLYCPKGHQYYQGEVADGSTPHGKGKLSYCCKQIPLVIDSKVQRYEGDFKRSKFQGYGTLTYESGVQFMGEFKNGLRNGQGRIKLHGNVESGRWVQDKLQQANA